MGKFLYVAVAAAAAVHGQRDKVELISVGCIPFRLPLDVDIVAVDVQRCRSGGIS